MPEIARGASLKLVQGRLTEAGCGLGTVTKKFSRRVKRGRLIRLKAEVGTKLTPGAEVPAVFSKGRKPSV